VALGITPQKFELYLAIFLRVKITVVLHAVKTEVAQGYAFHWRVRHIEALFAILCVVLQWSPCLSLVVGLFQNHFDWSRRLEDKSDLSG